MNVNKGLAVWVSACALTVATAGAGWSADAKAGKATYDKLCASCHGADGKGNPAMVKSMGEKGLNLVAKDAQAKSDADLAKITVEGVGKMPPSGKNLSKQEVQDVVAHMRSLAKK
jgi:mono/diheme cytochrome c family protein